MTRSIDRANRKQPSAGSNPNQGEGDKESAKRFNEQQEMFVKSERGQRAIDKAGEVSPGEENELAEAERKGRERAKDEDPAVTRGHRRSDRNSPDHGK